MSGLYTICGAAFGASVTLIPTDGRWAMLAVLAAIVVVIASAYEYERQR